MDRRNIEAFISHASLQIPSFINRELFQEADIYDDGTAQIRLALPKIYSIEDITEELEETLRVIPLYDVYPSKATTYGRTCCAYSNPLYKQYYTLTFKADEQGLVRNVEVSLYEDEEQMCMEIQDGLDKCSRYGKINFAKTENEVLLSFIQ